MTEQKTLGEKLAPARRTGYWAAMRNVLMTALNILSLTAILSLPAWWLLTRPDMSRDFMLVLLATLVLVWLLLNFMDRAKRSHFLLANDHQGFMHALRLDAKTAVIDGSNIYHFGHANKLDAQPLGEIAYLLRTQGYRVVCFFDANIFFTLNEHGAFRDVQQHTSELLEDIFGLSSDEIYVVPSKVQADKFILETLKHLPISFAVTNDRFRDYAAKYPDVMKDSQWRKGVEVSDGAVRLRNFSLKT